MSLPIDKVKGEFLEALDSEGPTVAVAPTGSGKSTRLPLWMDEALDGPVLVVEPRRVACRSLAEYLAGQRGEKPGESIGYRVRFEDKTSDKTRVIFATTGVVLRMLGSEEPWPFAGVVVDEFHERGWEVDLIVATLREKEQSGDPNFGPFVLTSATIEAGKLSRQLGADLIRSEGRTYPVDISYRGEAVAPTKENLEDRVRGAVEEVCQRGEDDGDILVFLPGKGEISDCKGALGSVAGTYDLELLEVHGRLPPHRMARVFDEDVDKRRVFLATNVAETSVTLPGVTTVIDSGLVKMRIHRGGRSALALVATSEASMDQRAGRAGRVQPGRCVRLWSQRYRPEETTPPEIERIELDEVILHAACAGLDGEAFDRAEWLTEPPAFAVEEARERLAGVGALDADHRLTDKGRRLAELPVDAHDARMLIEPPTELRGTLADIVSLLQRSTDLLLPMGATRGSNVRENRNRLFKNCDNKLYTELTALRRGKPKEHGLHRSAWDEARKVSASLRDMIDAPAGHPAGDNAELPDVERLASYLLERLPEYAFVLRDRAKRHRRDGKPKLGRPEPWGNGEVELSVYPFEPPVDERVRDDDPDYPEAGLVLDAFWIGDRGTGVRGIGGMVLPATRGQLADAGLGEPVPTSVNVKYGGLAPTIIGRVELKYAGTTLRTEERPLEGRPLCEKAAQLVFQGRLFKGSGIDERIREDLHIIEVMGSWPEPERYWEAVEEVPEAEAWLAEHFWDLGLRSCEDLALLEADDLRPDVAEVLGVQEFEIEKWREAFPRTWEHMGKRYVCRVQPSVRKVILEPDNKKAKKGDDPNARHLPRMKGFSVYFRNASRVVPVR